MFLNKLKEFPATLSLRFRLSLLFVIIFGGLTILFNASIFKYTQDSLAQDFDDALYNYAVDVSERIVIGVRGDLKFPPLEINDGKILPFPLGTALIQVRHISGEVLARVGRFENFDPPYKKEFEKLSRGDEASYTTVPSTMDIPSAEAEEYRLISFPLDEIKKPQLVLQIAVPMSLLEAQIEKRLTILILGIPLMLILATLAGVYLSSRALRPVGEMILVAQNIDPKDLSQRIGLPKSRDEIFTLGVTINTMLEKIQRAFQSQERFVADASHQLLTPLSIMKGEIEEVLRGADHLSHEQVKSIFKSNLQEVDHLSTLVQRLLLLARVDAGIGALNFQELFMDEVIMDTFRKTTSLADKKNIKVQFNLDLQVLERSPIQGDSELLRQMVFNLIENAIKYSPENSTIQVNYFENDYWIEIRISDEGPGVSEELIPYLFERFSRGKDSHKKALGYGLGLPVAQKIAKVHQGVIEYFASLAQGSVFSVKIKKN